MVGEGAGRRHRPALAARYLEMLPIEALVDELSVPADSRTVPPLDLGNELAERLNLVRASCGSPIGWVMRRDGSSAPDRCFASRINFSTALG